MNKILLIKAFRAILRNKGAYASCVLLVAIGVFSYISLFGGATVLRNSSETFYKTNSMADVFAEVNGIPYSEISSLKQINGVDNVSLRLTFDARMINSKSDKTIYLRLISYDNNINIPDFEGSPLVNNNDIWVSKNFLTANNILVGDEIKLIVKGKEVSFNVTASANAPDYIYTIKDIQALIPDNQTFGVAYVQNDYLNEILGTKNTNNDVNIKLRNGVLFKDIKKDLEESLKPYGLKSLIERKDQPSYKMLDGEVKQNLAMSTSMPVLFSGMASVVLFLMLKRLIEQERMQIGTLKAFGYGNFTILTHFILYGVITSLIGGIIGIVLGSLSIQPIVDMYTQFFILPATSNKIPLGIIIKAMSIALVFGIVGSFMGAFGILSLNPADSMRPPSPPVFKTDIIETFPILKKILTSRGNMGLRNMLRAKIRSIFIIMGIMFAYGSITSTFPMMELMTSIMKTKYTIIESYDAKLSLKIPTDASSIVKDTFSIDGVYMAEPLREIPAEITYSNRKKSYFIMGLTTDTKLYRLYDDILKDVVNLPKSGLLITRFVAEDLNIRVGDIVTVKTPYNNKKGEEIFIPVSAIIDQNMSSMCYIQKDILNNMLNLKDDADSIMIKTKDIKTLKSKMDDMKNVIGIEEPKNQASNFDSMMSSYSGITWIFFFLGIAISFAIIYNASVISMSEKKREYATLKVLGLTTNEVCEIHSFEYYSLCFMGCLLGIPFSYVLLNAFNEMIKVQMDNLKMPSSLSLFSIMMGLVGCLGAVILSNHYAKKEIAKLDMVDALNNR